MVGVPGISEYQKWWPTFCSVECETRWKTSVSEVTAYLVRTEGWRPGSSQEEQNLSYLTNCFPSLMRWLAGREFGDCVTVGCHWLQTVLCGGQSYHQREVIKVINIKMLKEQLSKLRKRESILRWSQDVTVTQQRMWSFIRYSDTETLHWLQEQLVIQSIPHSMTSKTRALLRSVEVRWGGTCLQLQYMGGMDKRSP